MSHARIPAELHDAVRRDLRPVRPLATPVRRALALLPLGLVLLFAFPELWRWQHHGSVSSPSAWALSAFETAMSLVVLAACFREAVPGRRLGTGALASLALASLLVFVLVNVTTRSPAGIPQALWLEWFGECIATALSWSVPAMLVPAWLVARALPARPGLTGALCGLGTGLMADAGMRIICRDGDYVHVLVAHGGAILVLMALGAATGLVVESIKARPLARPRRRSGD